MIVALWDLAVALLVLFPLLTGGIWFARPGLKLEFAELAPPVAIVAGLVFLFFRKNAAAWEKGRSVRAFRRFFAAWQESLARHPFLTLWSGAILSGALLSARALRRHWEFQSGSFDLGIFTNAIWNLTHGRGYVCSLKGGINLFADHQSPLFWILAPLFQAFPRAETLLIAQAFGLAAGGVALYFIGRQFKPNAAWIAPALPLLYWSYLPLRTANGFDFHPETLMLPLFLGGALGLQSGSFGRRLGGASSLLLAILAKESAGPIAAGLGLAWFLGAGPESTRAFTRKAGLALAGAGCLAFVLDTVAVPALLDTHYAYAGVYSEHGARSVLLRLLTFSRLKFLLWTLAPLGFVPLLNPRALVTTLPAYLMFFLSAAERHVSIQYHYGIEPAVGLFLALPWALHRLHARYPRAAAYWVLFWALFLFGRSEPYWIRRSAPNAHDFWLSHELIPAVDPEVALSATGALVPHLAARAWIDQLPEIQNGSCVIDDSAVNHWPMEGADLAALPQRLASAGFQATFRCGSVTVFERGGAHCLDHAPRCEPGD